MHERKQQNSAPIFYSEQWQNAFFQIVFRFVVLAVCANETMPVDLHPQESSNYTMCSVFVLNDGQKRKEEEGDSQENWKFLFAQTVYKFLRRFSWFLIFCWLQKYIAFYGVHCLLASSLNYTQNTRMYNMRIFIFIFPKKQLHHSIESQRDVKSGIMQIAKKNETLMKIRMALCYY